MFWVSLVFLWPSAITVTLWSLQSMDQSLKTSAGLNSEHHSREPQKMWFSHSGLQPPLFWEDCFVCFCVYCLHHVSTWWLLLLPPLPSSASSLLMPSCGFMSTATKLARHTLDTFSALATGRQFCSSATAWTTPLLLLLPLCCRHCQHILLPVPVQTSLLIMNAKGRWHEINIYRCAFYWL